MGRRKTRRKRGRGANKKLLAKRRTRKGRIKAQMKKARAIAEKRAEFFFGVPRRPHTAKKADRASGAPRASRAPRAPSPIRVQQLRDGAAAAAAAPDDDAVEAEYVRWWIETHVPPHQRQGIRMGYEARRAARREARRRNPQAGPPPPPPPPPSDTFTGGGRRRRRTRRRRKTKRGGGMNSPKKKSRSLSPRKKSPKKKSPKKKSPKKKSPKKKSPKKKSPSFSRRKKKHTAKKANRPPRSLFVHHRYRDWSPVMTMKTFTGGKRRTKRGGGCAACLALALL